PEPVLVVTGAVQRDVVDDLGIAALDPQLSAAIEAAVLSDARIIIADCNAAGGAGLELGDAADLPAAEQFATHSVGVAEERQVIGVVGDEDVTHVEIRLAVHGGGIIGVGNNVAL